MEQKERGGRSPSLCTVGTHSRASLNRAPVRVELVKGGEGAPACPV